MYLYVDKRGFIKAVSKTPIKVNGCSVEKKNICNNDCVTLVGTKVGKPKEKAELKVAVICNWGQSCGISTYTNFLLEALRPKISQLKIFSEFGCKTDDSDVVECWKRGQNMSAAIKQVLDWGPDFILIQHEFGIFPKATHFLSMLQMIDDIPYAVVLHSVYEHLDKSVCTSAIRNIIVHTQDAKETLIRTGNSSAIHVVHHGCVPMNEGGELWNIFQTPYCIVQFGFGFFYKGVDMAIDAISLLKKNHGEKYNDIFYCYLCSENEKTRNIQNEYYNFLSDKIEKLGLSDNVAIIRKYQTDEALSSYLRTCKMAIFPYITDPTNTVFGASGAIRIAMAHSIPVIASKSHLFDDLEGVLPRISNAEELATEIDQIFSDDQYKKQILDNSRQFVEVYNWDAMADRYLDVAAQIMS
jgi:glycosyltransferase involved in cell wall biosynthesis